MINVYVWLILKIQDESQFILPQAQAVACPPLAR